MDIDEVEITVKSLRRRLDQVEAKLDNANHILGLLVEALQSPSNAVLVNKVVRVILKERMGFLF
jgi:hypothetical protein